MFSSGDRETMPSYSLYFILNCFSSSDNYLVLAIIKNGEYYSFL